MRLMRIIKKITFILFLIVSFTYIFIVLSPRVFKNFYPFGIKTAVVLTGSMEPTLDINDFVIIKKTNNIEIGDIVSYQDETVKMEVLHRVVNIEGDKITTKGDANNTEDKPFDKSKITGVYIGKIKYLGDIISFITKPIVFSVIITIVLIVTFIPIKK